MELLPSNVQMNISRNLCTYNDGSRIIDCLNIQDFKNLVRTGFPLLVIVNISDEYFISLTTQQSKVQPRIRELIQHTLGNFKYKV